MRQDSADEAGYLDYFAKNKHYPAMQTTGVLLRRTYFPDSLAPVSMFRQRDQQPVKAHRHEFVEIVVVLSGWGLHATGQVRHEIRGGDVMVIHGKRSHAYERTKSLHLVNVLVTEKILEDAAREMGRLPGYHPLFTFEFARWEQKEFQGRLHLGVADTKKVSDWLGAMEEELHHAGETGYCVARAWLMVLIGFLSRCYGRDAACSPQLDMRLGKALARMDHDPSSNLSLSAMAAEAGMSERSFLRYFRKATGFSPGDYMIRRRILQAGEMLLEGDRRPITEIAFQCGFNDSNYFSRQFRRVTGKSPRDYRGWASSTAWP